MPINAKPRVRRLFKLRTILLVVTLSILLLPLSGLYFFRFYENELVRKTELELIAQSAVLSSIYRDFIHQNTSEQPAPPGASRYQAFEYYTPVKPQLDLANQPVLPRRPEPLANKAVIDTIDWNAGERMTNILRNTKQITLAAIRILDRKGTVVAGTNEKEMSLAHIPEIKKALKGEYTAVIRERISDEPPPSIASLSRGTGIRIFTAFPINNNGKIYGVVYLSRTPQNILKHMYEIRHKVLLFSALLLGITWLLVLFISSRLSRPIRELMEQTRKMTSGETDTVEVLRQPGTYELSQLSDAFSQMSHTVHERSSYIRQFASHVSHEFKTPLTSMQGALELLQEHYDTMPKEQRQRFLDNIRDDTQHLKKLVNRLLELARADAMKISPETTRLMPQLAYLQTRYAEKGLVISIENNGLNPVLKISKDAMETVLTNLFENSLQHDANNVHIKISTQKNKLKLDIQDNGKGISEANRKRIFTPFFTTRRDTGGTGLGLGIVSSLLQTWNGEIQLGEAEEGVLFHISLLHQQ
jgi:signal transduction histidine kinase